MFNMDKKTKYYTFFGFAQICGLIGFILVATYLSKYIGLSWSTYKFSMHPFFMVFGLVYFQGTSISGFRFLNNVERIYVKIFHAALHSITFVFCVLGLVAIFDSRPSGTHLQTFHGVLGIIIVIAFSIQWLCSFLIYLFPKASEDWRSAYMPYHRLGGLIIFALSVTNSLIGWNRFSGTDGDNAHPILAGFFILIFGIITVLTVASKYFRRDNISD